MADPHRKACPECGSTKYQRLPEAAMVQLVATTPARERAGLPPMPSGNALRLTLHVCDDCGYVRWFSQPGEVADTLAKIGL